MRQLGLSRTGTSRKSTFWIAGIFFLLGLLFPAVWKVQAIYFRDPLKVPLPVNQRNFTVSFDVFYEHAYALGVEAQESTPPGPAGCMLGLQGMSIDPGRCAHVPDKLSFHYVLRGPKGFEKAGTWEDHALYGYRDGPGTAEGDFMADWLRRGHYNLELTELNVPERLATAQPHLVAEKNGVDFTPELPFWILSGLACLLFFGLGLGFLIAGLGNARRAPVD